ncbi:MAG: hypothetical protein JST00_36850 [Deltaproteobacteria bacterium]|nr:hypothetical protein [Deltaproteobacteria bacterium]
MVLGARRSRATLVALGGAGAIATAVFACSTFGDEDDTERDPDAAPADVVADAPTADGAADAPPEAEPPSVVAPACPRPKPLDCIASGCIAEELYRPLPGAQAFPFAIATDSRSIFWIEQGQRDGAGLARVLRISKAGGPVAVLATDQPSATAIAVMGDHVYWGAANELRRVERTCTAPCKIEIRADAPTARHIAPAGPDALMLLAGDGTLRRHRVDTAGVAVVPISSVGTNNFLATGASENVAAGFTVDTIVVAPFAGTPVVRTITPPRDAGDKGFPIVGSDCKSYVGIGGSDSSLYKIDLDGKTSPLQNIIEGNGSPYGIAADDGVFYVAFANNGGLYAVNPDAKSAMRIAEGDIWRLTTDADGIYWGTHENGPGAGRLFRIRRK